MNKVFSIVWNNTRQTWVVAHELATRYGKQSSTKKGLASLLLTSLIASNAYAEPPAITLPTGGQVVAGQATISQTSNTLNVLQNTGKAAINWNSFSIGSQSTVNFIQPNSSSVALNRVIGSDPSQIFGRLNANGQVFLINPNGVLFGRGARVDVGGLVASTLNIKDADFLAGNYLFSGGNGSLVNEGELLGNYIALLAPEVRNQGVIVANQGTVVMAGGTDMTLNLINNQLIDVAVNKADINTLVENKHLIQADAGTVILTAQSANNLLGKVVNSGDIAAKGITSEGGKVRLTASAQIDHSGSINVNAGANGNGGEAIIIANLSNASSQTNVSGRISAKGGSQSGNGGFIETSANNLKVADTTRIDTLAANGKTGQWLLDPTDFTVAAAGGDITGATLGAALNSSSVTIDTVGTTAACIGVTCAGPFTGANGDIFITDNVTWTNASSSLTLKAFRNIEIDGATITAPMLIPFGPPPAYTLNMLFGQKVSGTYTIKNGATISDGFGGIPLMIAPDGSPMDPFASGFDVFGSVADFISAPTAFVRLNAGQSSTYGNMPSINYTTYLAANGTGASTLVAPGIQSGTDSSGSTGWETSPGGCTIFTPSECLRRTTHAGTRSYTYAGGLVDFNYYYIAGDAVNWTVNPRTLTATLTNTGITKVYDGTTDAPTGFTPTFSFTGFASGDTAAALSNAAVNYDSAHVANATMLTVNGLALTGITGSNGSLTSDYTLNGVTSASAAATITPATLTASLTNTGITKVYDGTTAAPTGFTPTYSFTGLVAGDTIANLGGSAAYNSARVVGANSVIVSGLNISGITGSNGSLTSDYTLNGVTTASAAATITPATLAATLTNTGITKVYDGTTDAPSGFTPTYSFTGLVAGDTDANLGGSAAYNSKNVLTASTITVTGLNIAGITGSNGSVTTDYNLNGVTTASAAAAITPATLISTLTNTGTTKVYDGTTAAPVGFTPTLNITGFTTGDTAAALSNSGAAYNSARVAGANSVIVSGLNISGITSTIGSVSSDYTLNGVTTASAAASITPATLIATLTNTGTTKVYDGTTAAPVGFTPTFDITGFATGDTAAALSNSGAAYNSARVAGANSVIVSSLNISGITGSNGSVSSDYTLAAPTVTAAATITPATLTATLRNESPSKVYDGTTAAPSNLTPIYTYTGLISNDTGANLGGGTAAFNSKDVRSVRTLDVTGLNIASITGSNGSVATDYTLASTSASTSASAVIIPATLAATAVGTKTDDGISTILGSLIRANGVNGEYFTFTGTGVLPTNLVNITTTASGNLANVNSLALDTANGVNGALASNYNLPYAPTDFNITVTPVIINPTTTTTPVKTAVVIVQSTLPNNQNTVNTNVPTPPNTQVTTGTTPADKVTAACKGDCQLTPTTVTVEKPKLTNNVEALKKAANDITTERTRLALWIKLKEDLVAKQIAAGLAGIDQLDKFHRVHDDPEKAYSAAYNAAFDTARGTAAERRRAAYAAASVAKVAARDAATAAFEAADKAHRDAYNASLAADEAFRDARVPANFDVAAAKKVLAATENANPNATAAATANQKVLENKDITKDDADAANKKSDQDLIDALAALADLKAGKTTTPAPEPTVTPTTVTPPTDTGTLDLGNLRPGSGTDLNLGDGGGGSLRDAMIGSGGGGSDSMPPIPGGLESLRSGDGTNNDMALGNATVVGGVNNDVIVIGGGGGTTAAPKTTSDFVATGQTFRSVPDIGDFTVQSGSSLNFSLPPSTFTVDDSNARLTFEARQSNGQPLPAWLRFDQKSGTFTGTPPAGVTQQISIEVIGRDEKGRQTSTHLDVNVQSQRSTPERPMAAPPQRPPGS